MASSKTIPVPVQGGIRQDVSEHMAPPGTLRDATNVRFAVVGEICARPGTNALSTEAATTIPLSAIQNGLGILERTPGGFVMGSSGFAYRYDFNIDSMQVAGSYANAEPLGIFDTVSREQIDTVASIPAPLSQAANAGYVAVCYSCGNGQGGIGPGDNIVICRVFTEQGALVSSAAYSGYTMGKVVADRELGIVLFLQDGTTNLFVVPLSLAASGVTFLGPSSIGVLSGAAAYWAVCTVPLIGWAIVYQNAAAQLTIKTGLANAVINTATLAITATTSPVSIFCDGVNLCVGWRDGTGPWNAKFAIYVPATLALSVAATTIVSEAAGAYIGPPLFGASGYNPGGRIVYAITRSPSAFSLETSWVEIGEITSAGAVTSLIRSYQCVAASSPFGGGYIWVRAAGIDANLSQPFERALLLDYMQLRTNFATSRTSWDPVIALSRELFVGAPGGGVTSGWYQQFLSPPCQLSDGSYVAGIPRVVRADGRGLAIGEWLQFELNGIRQTTTLGDEVLVAGWLTLATTENGTKYYSPSTTYALQRAGIDVGFPLPPATNIATSAGAGSLTSGATYQWRVVLERIDARGRRWRSRPGDTITLALGAGANTATLTINAISSWLRASGLRMGNCGNFVAHVYRTVGNGSTFYRCSPAQGAEESGADGLFTFVDTLSDASISVNEILYTDGGVLANDAPPSCRFVRATEDRIWLGGLWERNELQSSKLLVPGEPPQFSDSDAFRVALPENCTGIAAQDGVMIAFCHESIYAIQGAGPNDQGQSPWDSPRCVTRSTGCISHLSILETSIGIFFQSARGIELLPRGIGEPQFVGAPVQESTYSARVVSAASVTTFNERTARFVLSDGSLLLFDLNSQEWSRDIYPASIYGVRDTDSGAVLALVSGSAHEALQESVATDQDSIGNNPSEVSSLLDWADLRPFGVAGQGRFDGATALFDAKSAPSGGYRNGLATITLTADAQRVVAEPGLSWTMSAMSGAAYRRVVPRVQEGTAGHLMLSTACGGWRFAGWTVEVNEQGGARRMPETEQG